MEIETTSHFLCCIQAAIRGSLWAEHQMSRPFSSIPALVCFLVFSLRSQASELQWQTGLGYRSRPPNVQSAGRAGFDRMPGAKSGILFTNVLSTESGVRTQLRLAGSGVAAGDVDGDGWCDMFFCGMESEARLYRNLGEWRFEDITEPAGLRGLGDYLTGACFADVEGDGDLDLLLNSIGGGTRLFLNDGKGHFHAAPSCGLLNRFGATTLTFGDVDGDGTLDLYTANNNSPTALGDE